MSLLGVGGSGSVCVAVEVLGLVWLGLGLVWAGLVLARVLGLVSKLLETVGASVSSSRNSSCRVKKRFKEVEFDRCLNVN